MEDYIYKKEVDWSVLHLGIHIPVSIQIVFYNSTKNYLKKGESKNINLILANNTYQAKLINQKFDIKKYSDHKEILQIRYSPSSEISKKLREIFFLSYKYLKLEKSKLNPHKHIKIPEDLREYIALYTTQFEDTFFIDCITAQDMKIVKSDISKVNEEDFELEINYNKEDRNARIEYKKEIKKLEN